MSGGAQNSLMIAFQFIAFVLSGILQSGQSSSIEGNYDVTQLFHSVEPTSTENALVKLLGLPLKYYEFKLDSISGRRLLGFLGSDVTTALPESVEILPSYSIPQKNRTKSVVVLSNFPLVDKSSIFIYGIGAAQELQKRIHETTEAVELADKYESELSRKLTKLKDYVAETQWIPASQMKTMGEIEILRHRILNISLSSLIRGSEVLRFKIEHRRYLHQTAYLDRHRRITDHLKGVWSNISLAGLQKIEELDILKRHSMEAELSSEARRLSLEFQEECDDHELDIRLVPYLAKYRSNLTQELRDEEHEFGLMKAKDEILRQEILSRIDGLFVELRASARKLSTELSALQLLIYAAAALLGLLFTLILQELYGVIRAQWRTKARMGFSPPLTKISVSADDGRMCSDELILSYETAKALRAYCSRLKHAVLAREPLPSLLLVGGRGSGEFSPCM
jgi:ATPase family AAA domain-containing protein 3A/B